jgi:hypothetical protein
MPDRIGIQAEPLAKSPHVDQMPTCGLFNGCVVCLQAMPHMSEGGRLQRLPHRKQRGEIRLQEGLSVSITPRPNAPTSYGFRQLSVDRAEDLLRLIMIGGKVSEPIAVAGEQIHLLVLERQPTRLSTIFSKPANLRGSFRWFLTDRSNDLVASLYLWLNLLFLADHVAALVVARNLRRHRDTLAQVTSLGVKQIVQGTSGAVRMLTIRAQACSSETSV